MFFRFFRKVSKIFCGVSENVIYDAAERGLPEFLSSIFVFTRAGLVMLTIGKSETLRKGVLVAIIAAVISIGGMLTWHSRSLSSEAIFAEALKAVDERDVQKVQDAITLLKHDPRRESELTLLRGARSLLLNRPDLALKEFSEVDPTGQLRIPLLLLTGEALYRVDQFLESERCLQQASSEAPDNANAHRWLATVHYDLGRLDLAIFHLEAVSRIEPKDFRPHRMRGVIYHDFGEDELALKALQQAADLAVAPRDQSEVLVTLAAVHIRRKEFQAALQLLERCQQSSNVLTVQAECLWNLGDSTSAEEKLSQAETLGTMPVSGQRLRARMLIEKQMPSEAIIVLQKVLMDDASDDESEYLLAMSYRLLKDNLRYSQHLQRSEELKKLKLKLTSLSQTAIKEPENPQVRNEIAVVCDQLGMPRMAKVWRSAAAACNPNSEKDSETP